MTHYKRNFLRTLKSACSSSTCIKSPSVLVALPDIARQFYNLQLFALFWKANVCYLSDSKTTHTLINHNAHTTVYKEVFLF